MPQKSHSYWLLSFQPFDISCFVVSGLVFHSPNACVFQSLLVFAISLSPISWHLTSKCFQSGLYPASLTHISMVSIYSSGYPTGSSNSSIFKIHPIVFPTSLFFLCFSLKNSIEWFWAMFTILRFWKYRNRFLYHVLKNEEMAHPLRNRHKHTQSQNHTNTHSYIKSQSPTITYKRTDTFKHTHILTN